MANFKNAFYIKATIEGKSWETKAITLASENESEAIDKAKIILSLSPEHIIETENVKVFPHGTVLENNNYPYGRLKCTATYTAEYNKKMGFRTVFQTINPKNGRLNAPKKSTYYNGIVLPCEKGNGHFSSIGVYDLNGTFEINKGLHFMNDFQELLPDSIIKDYSLIFLSIMKVSMKAAAIYKGSDVEKLKELFDRPVTNMVAISKGEHTNFLGSILDLDAMKSLEQKDFQPFSVKESFTIGW